MLPVLLNLDSLEWYTFLLSTITALVPCSGRLLYVLASITVATVQRSVRYSSALVRIVQTIVLRNQHQLDSVSGPENTACVFPHLA